MKGRGLGVDTFNPAANADISDALKTCRSKLHLQEDFMTNNYVVYNAYKHEQHEIFTFNRIIKEFFTSCSQLIGHSDLLGKLFNDAMHDFRGNLV